jgi:hypothetical protein
MTNQQLIARRNAALERSVAHLDLVLGSSQFGWHVESAQQPNYGTYYRVTPQFECNCPAGQQALPCWHAAACWRLARGLGSATVVLTK